MTSIEKLSAEDVAILRLESPRIAGHVCKVITVDPSADGAPLSLDRLRDHLASRLDRVPRLRKRLSEDSSDPAWVADARFDIRNHVLPWDASAPADRTRMLDIVAQLMATRLDRSRPLWSIHVVELEAARRALVLLVHHSLADGATIVRLCSEVLWEPLRALPEPAARPHPAATAAHAMNLRGWVRRELMPSAVDTPLDRHPSTQRRVAVTRASLADIKHIGKTVGEGATVNDVVLCAVAGGLRRWLEKRGGSLHDIRVKVPVSLHDQSEHSNELGNHDSFMVVDVGADEPDPAARLRAIAAQTRVRKVDHDAQSLDALFTELRQVSALAARALSAWSTNPHVFTINVSNVPGPRVPVAVMGAPVRDLFSLAEIADRHALRVAVMSLADEVSFGLCVDAAAVPDPGTIAVGIDADLGALAAARG